MTSVWVVGIAGVGLIGLLLIDSVKRSISCLGCLLNIVIGLILIAAGLHLLVSGGYLNPG